MRYLLTICLAALCGCAKSDNIAVYYAGGAHGHFWSYKDAAFGGKEGGGFAVLKNLLRQEKKPHMLIVGGDWSTGTAEGAITKGDAAVRLMNLMNISAAAPGSGEFALGRKRLEETLAGAKFPVVCANIYDAKKGVRAGFCRPYSIFKAGPVKIGVIGVVGPSALKSVAPDNLHGLTAKNPVAEAKRQVADLARKNIKFIIALTQFSGDESEKEFAAAVPEVSMVIGAEGIVSNARRGEGMMAKRVEQGFSRVLKLDIEVGTKTGKLLRLDGEALELDKVRYGEDAAAAREADDIRAGLEKSLSRVIGSASEPLPNSKWPDSPLGNWTADCLRRWGRADFGIVPEDVFGVGIEEGKITLRQIYEIYPQDANAVFFKMRGYDIKKMLDGSLKQKGQRFFISGAQAEINEKGDQLLTLSVNGKEISDGKIYHVCAGDNMLARANGLVEFINTREPVREKLRWCIGRERAISPPETGRWAKQQ